MEITTFSNRSLALGQNSRLLGDIAQPTNNLFVAINEPVDGIWYTYVVAELLHKLLGSAEIVTRNARV